MFPDNQIVGLSRDIQCESAAPTTTLKKKTLFFNFSFHPTLLFLYGRSLCDSLHEAESKRLTRHTQQSTTNRPILQMLVVSNVFCKYNALLFRTVQRLLSCRACYLSTSTGVVVVVFIRMSAEERRSLFAPLSHRSFEERKVLTSVG